MHRSSRRPFPVSLAAPWGAVAAGGQHGAAAQPGPVRAARLLGRLVRAMVGPAGLCLAALATTQTLASGPQPPTLQAVDRASPHCPWPR